MKVVVVGAGYAGTIAANRLVGQARDAEITVINPRSDFVERVRLHERVAATGAASTPLTSMLRGGITAQLGTVDKIGDGGITLDDGGSDTFDYLFLAVGSTVVPLPGAVAVGTWEGAELACSALAALTDGSTVTVVGGGSTGVETASEIAEARPDLRVRLVGASIATTLSPRARQRVRVGLERLRVEVVEEVVVEVCTGPGRFGGVVRLRSGAEFASDLTLWAIVADVPDLAARSGLEVNPEGRAVVDEYLRSVNDPRVFVIGDCAAVPGARPSCEAAIPQGAHAADTLARIVNGLEAQPFSMGYAAQFLSLGRSDGVVQPTRRDDTARRLYIAGRTAAVAKERMSRYAKYSSRTANYAWLSGPK
ncbi:NAD(P)/FAD-dependent oxidoreductase [Nocardia noduli]|uniref:NAD(P)/FAD-dependent oxidoreductase n=1 Tax=Nocardia noduli TaxID=2815722 RepID=UPI001C23B2B5|nr:FAD-dependent oxidoreductase [Nocardia noduli]